MISTNNIKENKMATTTIKGGSFGREKKGTSPSSSSSLLKKSPKHSSSFATSSSSSSTKEKTLPSANEKPVPNYLKPTMASSLDFSRLPKKSAIDTTFQKPLLNRRRSFERPAPVSSQVNKALRNVAPSGSETKHIRSSSFSHKPGPTLDRMYARTSSSSSTLRESKVEPTLSKPRNLRKSSLATSSSTATSKNGANNVDAKKESKSVISESRIDDHSVADHFGVEGDFVGNDYEVQSLPEISEMPDSSQELGDPAITDIEVRVVAGNGKEIQDDKGKSQVVDQVEEHADIRLEKITFDHKPDEKRINTVETKPEPETTEEKVSDQAGVTLVLQVPEGIDKVDKEVLSVPNVRETEKLAEENKEELVSEHNEFEKSRVQAEVRNESPSPSGAVDAGIVHKSQSSQETSSSQSTPNNHKSDVVAATTAQKVGGKKEKQEYNDVIEETASKLRGKKNKVLALAGAFETVISLEGSKKK